MRILIADDNETNRIILKKMVEGFDCTAEAVESGSEAIDTLRSAAKSGNPFKVLLLDMQMPGMDGEHTTIIVKNTPEIKNTVVIILTSLGSRGDVAQLRKIGCAGYLVKPVKQSLLLDVVTEAINARGGKKAKGPAPLVTRYTIDEIKLKNINILLVEDNPINQKMAATMLKKAGYRVDTANNGKLAVEAFDKNRYDLIFMDIQMPEMDGFEATKIIREKEGNNQHNIIIAMTAHAMKGDREQCLEAGMDDYITKPIDPQGVFSIIDKWVKGQSENSSSQPGIGEPLPESSIKKEDTQESPVDLGAAMSRFGDDKAFYKELLAEFLKYAPEQIKSLDEAARSQDAAMIQKHAHSIKGAAGNLSAGKAYSIAKSIEHKGRDKEVSDVMPLIEDLTHEVLRLKDFIAGL